MTASEPIPADLLAQAADWRLLSLLFEPPCDAWREDVRALSEATADLMLRAAAQRALVQAEPALYHSTFGPGGPANPREIAYHPRTLPGGTIAEIEGYYAAFGYAPRTEETPDHVAVESGFIAFLRFKEAYAASRGETDQATMTAQAAARFVGEHLAMMAQPLADSLRNSGLEHLALAAEALRARTGPPPVLPEAPPLTILDADDEEEGCST